MTVKTIADAWIVANLMMKHDYQHDSERSKNAGYPIYFTTKEGGNEWISDLGDRLEVNQGCNSTNIWIEDEQQKREGRLALNKSKNGYMEQRRISADELRTVCILHDWYTRGSCNEYEKLFQKACSKDHLTIDDIEDIARNIIDHSTEESLDGYEFEDVMYAITDRTHTTVKKS